METKDPVVVDTPTVRCDGGGGPLGHPAVYLNFGENTELVCPYCSRHFIRSAASQAAAGH